jgi:hypothetical protein
MDRKHSKQRWGSAILLTQLRPLKHLQFRVRVQQPLNGLDVLFILEPRKHIQVIQCLIQVSVERSQISISILIWISRLLVPLTPAPRICCLRVACSPGPCE